MSRPEVVCNDLVDITTCLNILNGIKIRFKEVYLKYLKSKEDESD